jgi:hypothetical protein
MAKSVKELILLSTKMSGYNLPCNPDCEGNYSNGAYGLQTLPFALVSRYHWAFFFFRSLFQMICLYLKVFSLISICHKDCIRG